MFSSYIRRQLVMCHFVCIQSDSDSDIAMSRSKKLQERVSNTIPQSHVPYITTPLGCKTLLVTSIRGEGEITAAEAAVADVAIRRRPDC